MIYKTNISVEIINSLAIKHLFCLFSIHLNSAGKLVVVGNVCVFTYIYIYNLSTVETNLATLDGFGPCLVKQKSE